MNNTVLEENCVIGIDIGGSHITAGLIDLRNRRLLNGSIVRRSVNCHAAAEDIFDIWVDTINDLRSQINGEIDKIGFAMPGPFLYNEGISKIKGFDKYEALYNLNVRNILAQRLGLEPLNVLFRNDAEAFLEGEMFCGAAVGFADVIGITLGTGLGSAISHNNKTWDAELSITEYMGEIIEESVSTRGLLRNYFELTNIKLKDAEEIADLANKKDENALKTFHRFSHDLAWFLTKFIQQEEPQILVIGGNIIHSCDLFIPETIKLISNSIATLPRIVKATLGEKAALIGGACLHESKKVDQI